MSPEVDGQFREIEVLKVEGYFCEAVVLVGFQNDVKVIADGTFADDRGSQVGSDFGQTHSIL